MCVCEVVDSVIKYAIRKIYIITKVDDFVAMITSYFYCAAVQYGTSVISYAIMKSTIYYFTNTTINSCSFLLALPGQSLVC